MNGLQCPIRPRHMEVCIDHRAILPVGRKALYYQIEQILLVPHLIASPQLQVSKD